MLKITFRRVFRHDAKDARREVHVTPHRHRNEIVRHLILPQARCQPFRIMRGQKQGFRIRRACHHIVNSVHHQQFPALPFPGEEQIDCT